MSGQTLQGGYCVADNCWRLRWCEQMLPVTTCDGPGSGPRVYIYGQPYNGRWKPNSKGLLVPEFEGLPECIPSGGPCDCPVCINGAPAWISVLFNNLTICPNLPEEWLPWLERILAMVNGNPLVLKSTGLCWYHKWLEDEQGIPPNGQVGVWLYAQYVLVTIGDEYSPVFYARYPIRPPVDCGTLAFRVENERTLETCYPGGVGFMYGGTVDVDFGAGGQYEEDCP